jgi:hypothetical protein
MRKANYQNGIASGIAGWQYTGDELGTFDGSFYGNYTSYYIRVAVQCHGGIYCRRQQQLYDL